MAGVQKENCSEGGQNVGYIDTGDWMAYRDITFPTTGSYRIEYRVASDVHGARLSADLNAGSVILGQVSIPNTGGWQNWVTVSHEVRVTAGTYPFGLYATAGGWNINWIKITRMNTARNATTQQPAAMAQAKEKTWGIYPNPANQSIYWFGVANHTNYAIYRLDGTMVQSGRLNQGNGHIGLGKMGNGWYIIKRLDTGEARRFLKTN